MFFKIFSTKFETFSRFPDATIVEAFKSSSEVVGAYRSYYKPNGEYVKVNNVYGFKQTVAEGTDQAGNEYVKYGNNYVKMTKEADQFGRTTVINEKKSYNNISFKTEFTYKGVAGNSNRKTDLINTFKQSYDNNILANLFYEYDANNNITEVKSNSNNSTMYAYSYNSRDELHSFTDYINRDYYTYTYDEAGNILSKNHQNLNEGNAPVGTVTTTSYEYNNSEWQDLLTKYGNDSITYDTIGNPLNYRSGMTMTWSGRDLTSITKSGDTYSYTYNINGYRTKKVANGDTYYYYYDSDNKLIGMQTGVHTYVFYYDNEGKIHSMEENGDYYYFVKNAEGDVIAITNHHGTPIVKYTYDAWGKTMSVKDNNGQDISSTSYYAKTIPFRFRGYAYDNESGLYYLNSRYYDPETGRFINADSYIDTESGTPMSTNMFAYCENNPVMGYDPEGYWSKSHHRDITSKKGFKNKTVLNWVQLADDSPCKSTTEYSTPFHGRKNGLSIAKRLFNLARRIKNSKKASFFYTKNTDKSKSNKNKQKLEKLPKCLTYQTKKGKLDYNKNHAQEKFLKLINGTDKNKQYKKILGLALHATQDYFAHQVLVKAIKSKNDYFGKKGAKLEEKYSKRAFYKMNEIIYSDNVQYGRDHFEDDPKVFWWRNCYAKTVTEQAYKLWHMNKRINILRTEQKENNLIYKHKIPHNGSYWTVKARQFFLVVNSNWFLGYMKF